MSRRLVLSLATGSILLGGLAAPALAAPAEADKEAVCVITKDDPKTGERDGFCVWFPKVIPDLP